MVGRGGKAGLNIGKNDMFCIPPPPHQNHCRVIEEGSTFFACMWGCFIGIVLGFGRPSLPHQRESTAHACPPSPYVVLLQWPLVCTPSLLYN